MPTDYKEFAKTVKAKYPQYKDVDDLELAQKMVDKFPEYKTQVTFDAVKKKEDTPIQKKKDSTFSLVTKMVDASLDTSKQKTAQKPSVSSGGKAKPQVFTGYPGKEDKKYILDESTGKQIWKETVSGGKLVNGKAEFKIRETPITDPARVVALNKQFNKNASTDINDQIFTGYPGKELNEYRINNGTWQRRQPKATSWTDLNQKNTIDALNSQFKKSVKYYPAKAKFDLITEDENVQSKKDLDAQLLSVNSKLIGGQEEDAVRKLKLQFPGFKFIEQGAFTDEILVIAPNDKRINISLDNWTHNDDLNQSSSLREFIKANSNASLDKAREKMINAEAFENQWKIKPVDVQIKLGEGAGEERKLMGLTGTGTSIEMPEKDIVTSNIEAKLARSEYFKKSKETFQEVNDRHREAIRTTGNIDNIDVRNAYANLDNDMSVSRSLSSYMDDIADQNKSIVKEFEYLQTYTDNIKDKVASGEISEDEFNTVYAPKIEQGIASINSRSESLNNDVNTSTANENAINKSLAENLIVNASKGSFGGGIANNLATGLTDILRLGAGAMGANSSDTKKLQTELVRSIVGTGTTEEYMASEERSDISKTLFSLAKSMGQLATGGVAGKLATGAGATAKIANLAATIPFYAGGYYEMKDQFDDPSFSGVSDAEKVLLSTLYGTASGILEKYGLTKALGKTPMGKGLTNRILKASFKDLPKNASSKMVELSIENSIKKQLVSRGVNTIGAYLVEASTEAAQELTQVGLQEVYDLAKGNNYFKNGTGWDIASRVWESALLGGLGGGIMGTVSQSYGMFKDRKKLNNVDSVKLMQMTYNDANMRDLMLTNIKTKILNKEITAKEGKAMFQAVQQTATILTQLPDNLNDQQTLESVNLLVERSNIEKEIAGKDENLVAAQKARVAEINNELTKISEDATKESNVQEVTTEGGTVEYQGTGEGQQEVGISEGSQRETTQPGTDRGDSTVAGEVQEEVNSNDRTSWSKNGKEYKVGDIIDGNKLDELSGDLVGNFPNEKFILVQEPLSKFTDTREKLLSLEEGYEKEEIDRLESMKSNFDKTPPIPNDGDGMHRIISAKELGHSTILMWKNIKDVNNKEQVATLRAEEQAELADAIPNIEDYKVNGEIDKTLMTTEDLAKYNEIYDKYDKLITPLLPATKEGTRAVVSGIEIVYPTEEQKAERVAARSTAQFVEEASKDLPVEDVNILSEELGGEFGMLTAENPLAQPLTDQENKSLNKKAVQWLESRGYKPRRATGKYDQGENSFFVPNLSKEDAIAFAIEFNQESVAHSEGLVYQDGSMNPRDKSSDDFSFSEYNPESNFVSVIRTPDGLKTFSIGYDFENKIPASKTKEGPTVEQEVEAIGQLISGTDAQIDQKTSEVFAEKRMAKIAARAIKALSRILPEVKFIAYQTNEDYKAATKEGKNESSGGTFDPSTNTIHINLSLANARTVAHEVFHAILINKVKTNKNAADVTKRMVQSIASKIDNNPELKKKLENFISRYDENIQNEEKLSELVGMLAENYNSMSTSVKDIIARWIDKLANIFGLDPFNRNDTYDMLNTIARKVAKGKEISEGDVNMMSITGVTTNIVESTEPRKQVKVSKDQKLTFVTKQDIIDIDSLISDISSKNQKVWFWVADQLGRGNYFDSVLNGEHFLDAGPSFALDPENRSKNVIWASGANKKTLDNNIAKSDYIFIISGSPQRSKLFNKTVTNLIRRRIEGAIEFNNFKKELLESKPTSKIKSILEKYNSYEDLFMGNDRKNFIIAINEQQTKNTPAKKVLEKYNAFVDPNDLRDGFYQDNNFEMGDIMLVLKADKLGEKSKHSTYETDILGSVVGVPDKKINSYDIMPSEIKDKYRDDMSRSEQSQVVAPYGIGIKEISSRKQLAPEVSNKLTEDKSGNFVFHHYSNDKRDAIKPGTGQNIITGKEEGGALSAVGGLAMYYTMDNQVEPGVGNVLHTVLVPNGKVYDFNQDPDNFYDEAKKRFEEARPSQSFSPNYQLAFITQVANENGYDMVVARWRNNELRAQTTMTLDTSKDNVSMKPIAEETYKVGDDVEVYGAKGKITSIDGDMITFKGVGVGGAINFKRFPKEISKQITPRKQIAEEVTGIEETISPRKQKPKTINDIVKLTKDQGFSDAAIRQYLKDQGYSDKNINDAMEPDTGDVTVSKIREASQKELMDRQKKLTIRDRIRAIRNKFIDRQSDIKRLIKGIGSKESIRAYNLLVNKAGASGFANYRFKNAEADIYKGLKKNDLDTLDDIIYARRMVAINESRAKLRDKAYDGLDSELSKYLDIIIKDGANNKIKERVGDKEYKDLLKRAAMYKEPYTSMDGYSDVKALKDLDAIKNKIGEKKFNDLSERATTYFGVFSENLKKLYESGRINEETYINLRDIEYSPIRTIKYIIGDNLDPATVDKEASKLGVSKKDIMALTDSNENAIIFDSKWLLMLNVMSVEGRAFENKMLNEFSDAIDNATQEQRDAMSEFIIDNPIVKQTSTGSIQYKYNQNNVPIGYSIVSFFKNGVKKDLVVKDAYATQLLDIKSSNQALSLIGTLSGAKILRFFATGGNPLFIIGNTAVDFQNILFFSDVYSKFKLWGGAQLSYDFVRKFLKGAATSNRKNVIYNEYVEHGGAMDFLSNDGLRSLKSLSPKNKILNISQKVLVGYGNIMSYLGEKSELAFRLAVYDKVKGDEISKFKKENGRDPDAKELDDIMYEATRNARETMDFNQGGTWVKTADNVMPYLNASMQGFRRPLEYAKNNPLGFTNSLIQAAVMAGSVAALSLAALMRSVGDDEEEKKKVLDVLESLSDYEKATYHIIFTGKKDKDGEYEYYRVKKLPVLSVMSTVAEQFTYKYLLSEAGIKYDIDQEVINKSISASTPFSPSDITSRNPLISGLLTYSFNWDSFTGEKIFREPRDKKIAATAEGMYDDKVEEIYKQIAPSLGLSPIRTKAAIEKIVTSENTNPMISIFYASINGFFNKDGYGAEFSDAFSNVFDASARKLKRTTNKDNIRYKEEDKIENQEMIIETDIYNKEQKVYNTIKKIYKDGKELSNGELVDLIKTNFEKKDQEKYAKKYYAYIKNMNIDRSILDILYEETPEVQALRLYNRYGSELDSEEKKILSEVMAKAKMKLSKQTLYIYDKKYSKRK